MGCPRVRFRVLERCYYSKYLLYANGKHPESSILVSKVQWLEEIYVSFSGNVSAQYGDLGDLWKHTIFAENFRRISVDL